LTGESEAGTLACGTCGCIYPIVACIPHFIEPAALTGLHRRFSYLYDWFSWFYRLFSKAAFAYIRLPEEAAPREVLDRLEPAGGRVLEVPIGPGVNLPYLVGRPDVLRRATAARPARCRDPGSAVALHRLRVERRAVERPGGRWFE
jgi:hypothetical protein